VYPEDVENALRMAGIRDAVVIETRPGRIEAIVLAPGAHVLPQAGDSPAPSRAIMGRNGGLTDADPAALRARIDGQVKAANARLAIHQRVAAWRLWPQVDFPRTHTFKVKRDHVRAWAAVNVPLEVREEGFGRP